MEINHLLGLDSLLLDPHEIQHVAPQSNSLNVFVRFVQLLLFLLSIKNSGQGLQDLESAMKSFLLSNLKDEFLEESISKMNRAHAGKTILLTPPIKIPQAVKIETGFFLLSIIFLYHFLIVKKIKSADSSISIGQLIDHPDLGLAFRTLVISSEFSRFETDAGKTNLSDIAQAVIGYSSGKNYLPNPSNPPQNLQHSTSPFLLTRLFGNVGSLLFQRMIEKLNQEDFVMLITLFAGDGTLGVINKYKKSFYASLKIEDRAKEWNRNNKVDALLDITEHVLLSIGFSQKEVTDYRKSKPVKFGEFAQKLFNDYCILEES